MSDLINVISADVIGNEWDVFWQGTGIAANVTAKPVLVVSTPVANGGEEETVLRKLLLACDGDINKFHTVMLQDVENISWHKLRDAIRPKVVLLIGIHPARLGISALFNLNAVNHFDSCLFIPTNSIAEMQQKPDIKTLLWNAALKPVFKEKKYLDI